jgi:signal transduction histidine kinase
VSKPEMIRKLKHDFKRPLSNLQMLVIILKSGEMEKERLVGALEKIISEGNQALGLLDQMDVDEEK